MNITKWLKGEPTTKKNILFFVFGCVILLGLMAHAFGFLNLNLNHDYVTEYSLHDVTGWKLTIGRFMMPVVGVALGEYIAMPWFSGIFALLMIALSVYLILKIFGLKQRWQIILLSGLFVTNLAITAITASFMGDMVSDTFGLLLAVLAAFLWYKMQDKVMVGKMILLILCMAMALGCYQSHLSITVVLVVIKLIRDLLEGESAKDVFKKGLRGALPILVGVVLYYVIANIVCATNGLSLASGTTNSLSNIWSQDSSIFSRIIYTYIYVFWALFVPSISPIPMRDNVLPFSSDTWHVYAVCGINALILVFIIIALIILMKKTKMKLSSKIFVFILLLVMPFLANVSHFLSGYSHILMQLPFVLYYLLFIILVNKINTTKQVGVYLKRGAYCLAALVMAIVFIQIEYSNVIYTKKEIESKATLSTMTRVLSLVEEQKNYVFGETTICPIGVDWNVQDSLNEMETLAGVTGVEANSAISYQGVYAAYFKNVLMYPVNICTSSQMNAVMESSEYKGMGVFPDKTAIMTVNDIIVVKMSEE